MASSKQSSKGSPKSPSKAPESDNRRQHPRVELLAAVSVSNPKADGDNLVLPARNISLGGIYLGSDGISLAEFSGGAIVELSLFDGESDSLPPLRTKAQVVRVEAAGMALTWQTSDPKVALALAQILGKLTPPER